MKANVKGNVLSVNEHVAKSTGNIYYNLDVYCDDGDTVRIFVPTELISRVRDLKKFSEVTLPVSIRSDSKYGMRVSLLAE